MFVWKHVCLKLGDFKVDISESTNLSCLHMYFFFIWKILRFLLAHKNTSYWPMPSSLQSGRYFCQGYWRWRPSWYETLQICQINLICSKGWHLENPCPRAANLGSSFKCRKLPCVPQLPQAGSSSIPPLSNTIDKMQSWRGLEFFIIISRRQS